MRNGKVVPNRAFKTTKSQTSASKVTKPECPICLELYHEPITTRCGHTFCFHCLFLANVKECPMCRQGPLLVELGDFEEDSLMAMRVRIENSCVLPTSVDVTRPSSNGNNNVQSRKHFLKPSTQLLDAYKKEMANWLQTHDLSSTSTVNTTEYVAASLRTRLQLGRALHSHYTYDENQQHHMFYEGGFMWRRVPSLAVQRRTSESEDNLEGPNDEISSHRRSSNAPIGRRPPLPSLKPTTSHIDHLLKLEAEKRASILANRNGSNPRQVPSYANVVSPPLNNMPPAGQPLRPIMITPRGKVWATTPFGNGQSLSVVDVVPSLRQRPQSAAEQMEDTNLALATRAFLKQRS